MQKSRLKDGFFDLRKKHVQKQTSIPALHSRNLGDRQVRSRTEYESRRTEIQAEAQAELDAQRMAFNEEKAQLRKRFEQDMELEHNLAKLPVNARRLIHNFAWEQGHALGYAEVARQYDEIVEIALTAAGR